MYANKRRLVFFPPDPEVLGDRQIIDSADTAYCQVSLLSGVRRSDTSTTWQTATVAITSQSRAGERASRCMGGDRDGMKSPQLDTGVLRVGSGSPRQKGVKGMKNRWCRSSCPKHAIPEKAAFLPLMSSTFHHTHVRVCSSVHFRFLCTALVSKYWKGGLRY